jgi:hypothetical protein
MQPVGLYSTNVAFGKGLSSLLLLLLHKINVLLPLGFLFPFTTGNHPSSSVAIASVLIGA